MVVPDENDSDAGYARPVDVVVVGGRDRLVCHVKDESLSAAKLHRILAGPVAFERVGLTRWKHANIRRRGKVGETGAQLPGAGRSQLTDGEGVVVGELPIGGALEEDI